MQKQNTAAADNYNSSIISASHQKLTSLKLALLTISFKKKIT